MTGFIVALLALWACISFLDYCLNQANLAYERGDDSGGQKWLSRRHATLCATVLFFMAVAAYYRF